MPWVEFTGEYWHRVKPSVLLRYKVGWRINVPTRIANKAIAEGKAIRSSRPEGKLKSREGKHDKS